MGRVEALVVMDPQIVAEPDDGGPPDRGPVGGFHGPARAQRERVVKRVSGYDGLERELRWRRRYRGGGERKMSESRCLGWWYLNIVRLRKQGGDFGLLEKIMGWENCRERKRE